MAISVFDLFKIGIGPSSSHTVGPMRAARTLRAGPARRRAARRRCGRVRAELFGSLGATGHGHGSDKAVLLGLEGEEPETGRPATPSTPRLARDPRHRRGCGSLGTHEIAFDADERPGAAPPRARCRSTPTACASPPVDARRRETAARARRTTRSAAASSSTRTRPAPTAIVPDDTPVPYPFPTGDELLAHCARDRPADQRRRCSTTSSPGAPRPRSAPACCTSGRSCRSASTAAAGHEGILPGGLKVQRRAAAPATRSCASERRATRPAARHGLGQPVRAGGQRGERRRRPRGHRADQRRRRHHPGGAALLHALRARRRRRRRRPLPAHRRRDRHAVQGERLDLRRRGRLPGRGRLGLLDGRRRARRGARRHARRRSRTPPRSAWSTTSA